MARGFLIRGMLSGFAGGILLFLFAKYFGEPQVDGAIGFEAQLAKAAGEASEPELVSRAVQASWGLFTGTMLYSIAIGGLFSLVFAFFWGRTGRLSPRSLAALLALGSFTAVHVVPFLKYPANPPSVGIKDTLEYRTQLYFGMILISIIAMVAAVNLGRSLAGRLNRWHAIMAAAVVYLAIIVAANIILPSIDEVPAAFPATLLWQFRIASLGMQAILWTTLGLLFGELTERNRSLRVGHPIARSRGL